MPILLERSARGRRATECVADRIRHGTGSSVHFVCEVVEMLRRLRLSRPHGLTESHYPEMATGLKSEWFHRLRPDLLRPRSTVHADIGAFKKHANVIVPFVEGLMPFSKLPGSPTESNDRLYHGPDPSGFETELYPPKYRGPNCLNHWWSTYTADTAALLETLKG